MKSPLGGPIFSLSPMCWPHEAPARRVMDQMGKGIKNAKAITRSRNKKKAPRACCAIFAPKAGSAIFGLLK